MLFIKLLAVIKYLKSKIRNKFMYFQYYYNIAIIIKSYMIGLYMFNVSQHTLCCFLNSPL
jgi:hypothetical protein